MMRDERHDRLKAAYGENCDRLRQVKAAYDPLNLFLIHHNIPPAG
jgi:FAD/FMN-containing dehydrogenase